MNRSSRLLAALTCATVILPAMATGAAAATTAAKPSAEPLVIGHRGASGHRPEHTLAAYALAARMGADYVEPDLVSTKDHVLVARHENEISGTTDVAEHPEFASRKATKVIDGVTITGWFTEDFTLAELRTLRAKERIPALRQRNTIYDGRYRVPTLRRDHRPRQAPAAASCGRPIGIYPETKHPSYFRAIGLALEEPLVAELRAARLDRPWSKVFIQSFEVGNLKALNRRIAVPLVQLLGGKTQKPADDPRTYAAARHRRWADGDRALRRRRRPVEGLHRAARRGRQLAGADVVRAPTRMRPACSCIPTPSATRTASCRSSCAAAATRRRGATRSPSTSSSSRSASTASSRTIPTPPSRPARGRSTEVHTGFTAR